VIGVPLELRAPSGVVKLGSNLLLAPIAGWCDLAWRMTVRELGGVGLACTDLLSPQGLLCGSEASKDLARTGEGDQPIGMQLYGSDGVVLAEGARWCADHGATVVDINMGCPVDKVCKKDGGSKLMCNVPNTLRVFEAVRRALPGQIPLTAKMRLGWDEAAYAARVADELAVGLCGLGAAMITVHGRTTEMMFKGSCRREGIRRVVESVGAATGAYDGTAGGGVPVIGNGDVKTADDAMGMLRETGCAGVMIGRGAFGNPWVFAEAWGVQKAGQSAMGNGQWGGGKTGQSAMGNGQWGGGKTGQSAMGNGRWGSVVTDSERLDVVLRYFERMREFRGDWYAMHKIRQKISWLGKTINGSHCRELKDGVREAQSPAGVVGAVEAFRAQLAAGVETAR
jgi:nifR3 family TIM-barrel protein